MFNFLTGTASVFGGIYLVEAMGDTSALMSAGGGFLVLFGIYKLVMTILDTA